MLKLRSFQRLLSIGLVLVLLPAAPRAQTLPQPAPIPPKLLSKTVFLSNAGSDSGLFPSPFSGGPSRPYDYLYRVLSTGGVYTLVNDPAKADVVFEIQVTAPSGPQSPNKVTGASDPLPMVRLTIYDRATHFVLWSVTESVEQAYQQKTHDANLDHALDRLLNDLKSVATPNS
jgi:hypothetical protein